MLRQIVRLCLDALASNRRGGRGQQTGAPESRATRSPATEVGVRTSTTGVWRQASATLALALAAYSAPVAAQGASNPIRDTLRQGAESEQIVSRYIAAFNRHDIAAMLELAHPDVVWLSVVGDSVRVETRGASALATQLSSYFRSYPTAASVSESVIGNGPWVAVHERATWHTAGEMKTQSALAVYEIRAKKVERVWYYPLVR